VIRNLPRHQVDHLDSVVSERGDEKPFALGVQPKVIDPALDSVQRNRLDLSQQVGALAGALRVGAATERKHRRDDKPNQLSGKFF
jgi:hypothetical protein